MSVFLNYEQFFALPKAKRNLVIYSEGMADWLHISSLVEALIENENYPFVYISSDNSDPGLKLKSTLVETFLTDKGGVRANLFAKMDADVLLMTTPDLQNLSLKKSARCGKYVYVFHSPVSTHMIYRPGAFDHFDVVFCVGPHHMEEIRQQERLTGGQPKQLIAHGYGRVDSLLRDHKSAKSSSTQTNKHVLIAPSWGPNGIFETMGSELTSVLLDNGFFVTARPHPQTIAKSSYAIEELRQSFDGHANFQLQTNMGKNDALYESDVMISDWSGAAIDYAFGLEKPVLFIDTPRKVNNPGYEDIGLEPMEVQIRERIGRLVSPEDLHQIPNAINEILSQSKKRSAVMNSERHRWIYNVGSSAGLGAIELVRISA